MSSVHHLKISLNGVRPLVWREVLIPSDIRLDRLHLLFQVAIGWNNRHLHEFSTAIKGRGERCFGPRGQGADGGVSGHAVGDERKASLTDLAPRKGDEFIYRYDFGDGWTHEVSVKAIGADNRQRPAPMCVKANSACPPEDCGGPEGYQTMLDVLADPAHEDHDMLLQRFGGFWDVDAYDIDAVNITLADLATRWRTSTSKARR